MQTSSRWKSILQFYKKDISWDKTKAAERTLHMTGASCAASFLIGTGKLIMGIVSMSFFTCVSALYTYAIVVSKGYVLYGLSQTQHDLAEQYAYYQRSGKLLTVAGTAYMVYSMNLFFCPSTAQFDQNMALGIAFFTFVEIGLNIRGMIMERKNHMPLFRALKIINLASSCICLVLTQTALLAYTSMESGVQNNSGSNGLIAILMGGLSTLLGVYLYIHADRMIHGKDIKKCCRKIVRIMKEEKLLFSFSPIQLSLLKDGTRLLQVELNESVDKASRKRLDMLMLDKVHLVMVDKNDTIV